MQSNLILPSCLCCLALLATGCADMPKNDHGAPLGASVSLTMAQQVLDPAAGMNRDPVSGMDGQAAKSAYDHYQKTYRAPEPQPNVFTIGVGGRR